MKEELYKLGLQLFQAEALMVSAFETLKTTRKYSANQELLDRAERSYQQAKQAFLKAKEAFKKAMKEAWRR